MVFFVQNGQLGSVLEAQEAPKSEPNPQQIDAEKRDVFNIDFGRVRMSFSKCFWKGFWKKNAGKLQKHAFSKNLKNLAPVETKR